MHAHEVAETAASPAAVIRAARAEDLPAVRRLLRGAALPDADLPATLAGFIVAESEGAVVGVAGLETWPGHALLRSVAVEGSWRSRGLGRALVRRAIADAEARGARSLYLLTTTAERYFPAFGFAVVGRDDVPADILTSQEFTSLCPASAVVMRRNAGAHTHAPSGTDHQNGASAHADGGTAQPPGTAAHPQGTTAPRGA